MTKTREHWGSQFGFIMAAAGSAIGLGTLWMFPYMTSQNGGGTFVLLYLLLTFIVGMPLFIAEVVLGRYSQRGAVGIFSAATGNRHSQWRIAGWLAVASAFVILSYYTVVAGWGLNYVLMSLNSFWVNKSPDQIVGIFTTLRSAGDITLFWHFVFSFITAVVVFQGIRKGIEHWSRIMTTGLLIFLIGLLAYSTQLSGFGEAVDFLFSPRALKPSGGIEALGMALFTLSLAQGIMLTYGSYMKPTDNIPRTAGIISATVIIISILASLMIFPIMFTYQGGVSAGDPGIIFQTVPLIFGQLPGALVFSTLFFLLFVFAGLTSAVALLEVVVANAMDLLGWSRKKAVIIAATAAALFGIPSALSSTHDLFADWDTIYGQNFFDTMSGLVASWMLPLGGLLTAIFAGWVVDKELLKREFCLGSNAAWLFTPWRFLLRWVVPSSTLIVLLYKAELLGGLLG